MFDYSVILKRRFPDALWHGSGSTYQSIVWDQQPIAQSVLDAELASVTGEVVLERAERRLVIGYQAAVASGYTSAALGTLHWYSGTSSKQADLTASVLLTILPNPVASVPYGCSDVSVIPPIDGVYLHTAAQIQQVTLDGAAFKQSMFVKLQDQITLLSGMGVAELKLVAFVP